MQSKELEIVAELTTIKGNAVTVYESESGLGVGKVVVKSAQGTLEIVGASIQFVDGKTLAASKLALGDVEIDAAFTYEAFYDPKGKSSVLLSKDGTIKYREALKSREKIKQAALRESYAKQQELLNSKIKGLDELRRAYREHIYYRDAFNQAMEDEQNDGVKMPTRPTSNIDELEAKYPLAKLYLKAESYQESSNYDKMSAGEKAIKMLLSDASIEEVQDVLDNWFSQSNVD